MSAAMEPFDPLVSFAAIERLVAKIYYRFSHLFMANAPLRDFWWEMAKEEEQHACILNACRALIENFYEDKLDPNISRERADALSARLTEHLAQGSAALEVDQAFSIALDIEASEIDAIYSKLIRLGGSQVAQTMENLGVPASVQRQKLRAAVKRFCSKPEVLAAAERL